MNSERGEECACAAASPLGPACRVHVLSPEMLVLNEMIPGGMNNPILLRFYVVRRPAITLSGLQSRTPTTTSTAHVRSSEVLVVVVTRQLTF
jgi:hypothetical protein